MKNDRKLKGLILALLIAAGTAGSITSGYWGRLSRGLGGGPARPLQGQETSLAGALPTEEERSAAMAGKTPGEGTSAGLNIEALGRVAGYAGVLALFAASARIADSAFFGRGRKRVSGVSPAQRAL